MDRRLLFPAVAVTAWAQQTNPAAAKAENALRARAQEFFQLQVDKKYRQGEAMVAEESKDAYYNGSKYNIKNFTVQKVELLDNNTRAKVIILAKVTMVMPEAGAFDFDAPTTSVWKIEKGQWVLYIDPAPESQTPFGTLKPSQNNGSAAPPNVFPKAPPVSALRELVTIDRTSLALTAGAPPETVAISNNLPGGVDLEAQSDPISGLSWELEKKHLDGGEKTSIRFQAKGDGKRKGVVHLLVSPTGAKLDILVTIN